MKEGNERSGIYLAAVEASHNKLLSIPIAAGMSALILLCDTLKTPVGDLIYLDPLKRAIRTFKVFAVSAWWPGACYYCWVPNIYIDEFGNHCELRDRPSKTRWLWRTPKVRNWVVDTHYFLGE